MFFVNIEDVVIGIYRDIFGILFRFVLVMVFVIIRCEIIFFIVVVFRLEFFVFKDFFEELVVMYIICINNVIVM